MRKDEIREKAISTGKQLLDLYANEIKARNEIVENLEKKKEEIKAQITRIENRVSELIRMKEFIQLFLRAMED